MVTIYTVQMAKWRKCKELGIELIDTTVKSGDPIFAPTWDIVSAVKEGRITPEQYTEVYLELMRKSFKEHRDAWLALLSKPVIAIACYCKTGAFCHRHLLLSYLEKACQFFGIPYTLAGEIT